MDLLTNVRHAASNSPPETNLRPSYMSAHPIPTDRTQPEIALELLTTWSSLAYREYSALIRQQPVLSIPNVPAPPGPVDPGLVFPEVTTSYGLKVATTVQTPSVVAGIINTAPSTAPSLSAQPLQSGRSTAGVTSSTTPTAAGTILPVKDELTPEQSQHLQQLQRHQHNQRILDTVPVTCAIVPAASQTVTNPSHSQQQILLELATATTSLDDTPPVDIYRQYHPVNQTEFVPDPIAASRPQRAAISQQNKVLPKEQDVQPATETVSVGRTHVNLHPYLSSVVSPSLQEKLKQLANAFESGLSQTMSPSTLKFLRDTPPVMCSRALLVDDEASMAAFTELKKRRDDLTYLINKFKRLAGKKLVMPAVAPRSKVLQDSILSEMEFIANDMFYERRWKISAAHQLATEAAIYHHHLHALTFFLEFSSVRFHQHCYLTEHAVNVVDDLLSMAEFKWSPMAVRKTVTQFSRYVDASRITSKISNAIRQFFDAVCYFGNDTEINTLITSIDRPAAPPRQPQTAPTPGRRRRLGAVVETPVEELSPINQSSGSGIRTRGESLYLLFGLREYRLNSKPYPQQRQIVKAITNYRELAHTVVLYLRKRFNIAAYGKTLRHPAERRGYTSRSSIALDPRIAPAPIRESAPLLLAFASTAMALSRVLTASTPVNHAKATHLVKQALGFRDLLQFHQNSLMVSMAGQQRLSNSVVKSHCARLGSLITTVAKHVSNATSNANKPATDPSLQFTSSLRAYQSQALQLIKSLAMTYGTGCLLADDSSLNRRIPTIFWLLFIYLHLPHQSTVVPRSAPMVESFLQSTAPSLIVVPTQALHYWTLMLEMAAPALVVFPFDQQFIVQAGLDSPRSEFDRYSPQYTLFLQHELPPSPVPGVSERLPMSTPLHSGYHVCLTTFEHLHSYHYYFQRQQWRCLVLDSPFTNHHSVRVSHARMAAITSLTAQHCLVTQSPPLNLTRTDVEHLFRLLFRHHPELVAPQVIHSYLDSLPEAPPVGQSPVPHQRHKPGSQYSKIQACLRKIGLSRSREDVQASMPILAHHLRASPPMPESGRLEGITEVLSRLEQHPFQLEDISWTPSMRRYAALLSDYAVRCQRFEQQHQREMEQARALYSRRNVTSCGQWVNQMQSTTGLRSQSGGRVQRPSSTHPSTSTTTSPISNALTEIGQEPTSNDLEHCQPMIHHLISGTNYVQGDSQRYPELQMAENNGQGMPSIHTTPLPPPLRLSDSGDYADTEMTDEAIMLPTASAETKPHGQSMGQTSHQALPAITTRAQREHSRYVASLVQQLLSINSNSEAHVPSFISPRDVSPSCEGRLQGPYHGNGMQYEDPVPLHFSEIRNIVKITQLLGTLSSELSLNFFPNRPLAPWQPPSIRIYDPYIRASTLGMALSYGPFASFRNPLENENPTVIHNTQGFLLPQPPVTEADVLHRFLKPPNTHYKDPRRDVTLDDLVQYAKTRPAEGGSSKINLWQLETEYFAARGQVVYAPTVHPPASSQSEDAQQQFWQNYSERNRKLLVEVMDESTSEMTKFLTPHRVDSLVKITATEQAFKNSVAYGHRDPTDHSPTPYSSITSLVLEQSNMIRIAPRPFLAVVEECANIPSQFSQRPVPVPVYDPPNPMIPHHPIVVPIHRIASHLMPLKSRLTSDDAPRPHTLPPVQELPPFSPDPPKLSRLKQLLQEIAAEASMGSSRIIAGNSLPLAPKVAVMTTCTISMQSIAQLCAQLGFPHIMVDDSISPRDRGLLLEASLAITPIPGSPRQAYNNLPYPHHPPPFGKPLGLMPPPPPPSLPTVLIINYAASGMTHYLRGISTFVFHDYSPLPLVRHAGVVRVLTNASSSNTNVYYLLDRANYIEQCAVATYQQHFDAMSRNSLHNAPTVGLIAPPGSHWPGGFPSSPLMPFHDVLPIGKMTSPVPGQTTPQRQQVIWAELMQTQRHDHDQVELSTWHHQLITAFHRLLAMPGGGRLVSTIVSSPLRSLQERTLDLHDIVSSRYELILSSSNDIIDVGQQAPLVVGPIRPLSGTANAHHHHQHQHPVSPNWPAARLLSTPLFELANEFYGIDLHNADLPTGTLQILLREEKAPQLDQLGPVRPMDEHKMPLLPLTLAATYYEQRIMPLIARVQLAMHLHSISAKVPMCGTTTSIPLIAGLILRSRTGAITPQALEYSETPLLEALNQHELQSLCRVDPSIRLIAQPPNDFTQIIASLGSISQQGQHAQAAIASASSNKRTRPPLPPAAAPLLTYGHSSYQSSLLSNQSRPPVVFACYALPKSLSRSGRKRRYVFNNKHRIRRRLLEQHGYARAVMDDLDRTDSSQLPLDLPHPGTFPFVVLVQKVLHLLGKIPSTEEELDQCLLSTFDAAKADALLDPENRPYETVIQGIDLLGFTLEFKRQFHDPRALKRLCSLLDTNRIVSSLSHPKVRAPRAEISQRKVPFPLLTGPYAPLPSQMPESMRLTRNPRRERILRLSRTNNKTHFHLTETYKLAKYSVEHALATHHRRLTPLSALKRRVLRQISQARAHKLFPARPVFFSIISADGSHHCISPETGMHILRTSEKVVNDPITHKKRMDSTHNELFFSFEAPNVKILPSHLVNALSTKRIRPSSALTAAQPFRTVLERPRGTRANDFVNHRPPLPLAIRVDDRGNVVMDTNMHDGAAQPPPASRISVLNGGRQHRLVQNLTKLRKTFRDRVKMLANRKPKPRPGNRPRTRFKYKPPVRPPAKRKDGRPNKTIEVFVSMPSVYDQSYVYSKLCEAAIHEVVTTNIAKGFMNDIFSYSVVPLRLTAVPTTVTYAQQSAAMYGAQIREGNHHQAPNPPPLPPRCPTKLIPHLPHNIHKTIGPLSAGGVRLPPPGMNRRTAASRAHNNPLTSQGPHNFVHKIYFRQSENIDNMDLHVRDDSTIPSSLRWGRTRRHHGRMPLRPPMRPPQLKMFSAGGSNTHNPTNIMRYDDNYPLFSTGQTRAFLLPKRRKTPRLVIRKYAVRQNKTPLTMRRINQDFAHWSFNNTFWSRDTQGLSQTLNLAHPSAFAITSEQREYEEKWTADQSRANGGSAPKDLASIAQSLRNTASSPLQSLGSKNDTKRDVVDLHETQPKPRHRPQLQAQFQSQPRPRQLVSTSTVPLSQRDAHGSKRPQQPYGYTNLSSTLILPTAYSTSLRQSVFGNLLSEISIPTTVLREMEKTYPSAPLPFSKPLLPFPMINRSFGAVRGASMKALYGEPDATFSPMVRSYDLTLLGLDKESKMIDYSHPWWVPHTPLISRERGPKDPANESTLQAQTAMTRCMPGSTTISTRPEFTMFCPTYRKQHLSSVENQFMSMAPPHMSQTYHQRRYTAVKRLEQSQKVRRLYSLVLTRIRRQLHVQPLLADKTALLSTLDADRLVYSLLTPHKPLDVHDVITHDLDPVLRDACRKIPPELISIILLPIQPDGRHNHPAFSQTPEDLSARTNVPVHIITLIQRQYRLYLRQRRLKSYYRQQQQRNQATPIPSMLLYFPSIALFFPSLALNEAALDQLVQIANTAATQVIAPSTDPSTTNFSGSTSQGSSAGSSTGSAQTSTNPNSPGFFVSPNITRVTIENPALSTMNPRTGFLVSTSPLTDSTVLHATKTIHPALTVMYKGAYGVADSTTEFLLSTRTQRVRHQPSAATALNIQLTPTPEQIDLSDSMWRASEDLILLSLVRRYGTYWNLVSDLLTMHPVASRRLKTGRQCLLRYTILSYRQREFEHHVQSSTLLVAHPPLFPQQQQYILQQQQHFTAMQQHQHPLYRPSNVLTLASSAILATSATRHHLLANDMPRRREIYRQSLQEQYNNLGNRIVFLPRPFDSTPPPLEPAVEQVIPATPTNISSSIHNTSPYGQQSAPPNMVPAIAAAPVPAATKTTTTTSTTGRGNREPIVETDPDPVSLHSRLKRHHSSRPSEAEVILYRRNPGDTSDPDFDEKEGIHYTLQRYVPVSPPPPPPIRPRKRQLDSTQYSNMHAMRVIVDHIKHAHVAREASKQYCIPYHRVYRGQTAHLRNKGIRKFPHVVVDKNNTEFVYIDGRVLDKIIGKIYEKLHWSQARQSSEQRQVVILDHNQLATIQYAKSKREVQRTVDRLINSGLSEHQARFRVNQSRLRQLPPPEPVNTLNPFILATYTNNLTRTNYETFAILRHQLQHGHALIRRMNRQNSNYQAHPDQTITFSAIITDASAQTSTNLNAKTWDPIKPVEPGSAPPAPTRGAQSRVPKNPLVAVLMSDFTISLKDLSQLNQRLDKVLKLTSPASSPVSAPASHSKRKTK